ncbi:uncharacterized protein EMH_0012570 [Eimeria mitis]|uniref:Uncharacterized protein n=1 Tax=Eimeria mitis TaxID=44415 RepID=U6K456_9EIME|nr:uncharacterized protein EMH_0012570 [Eimeria mitis]CDJ32459.1 hypothetical protein EMH_0012570 [Eimeria mitis]
MLELIKEMKEDNRTRNEELVLIHRQATDKTDELLRLHRQANEEGRAHPEGRSNSPRDRIRRKGISASEDGTNIRSFLGVVEQEFRESEVSMEEWGGLLGKYLSGKAMTFLEFLKQWGVDMTDWKQVRDRLCERFWSPSREKMIHLLAENHWTGDYNEYINRFTEVVAQGERVPAEELVTWFFTLLPPDIGERITCEGTGEFHDWQEAATALRSWAIPLEAWRARRIRTDSDRSTRRVEHDNDAGRCSCGRQTIKRPGLGVKGDARTRPKRQTGGQRDQDETGPDGTAVSPNWRQDETGRGAASRLEGESSEKERDRSRAHPRIRVRLTDVKTELHTQRHVLVVRDSVKTGNGRDVDGSGMAKTSGTDSDNREERGEKTACGETNHGNGTEPTEELETKEATKIRKETR